MIFAIANLLTNLIGLDGTVALKWARRVVLFGAIIIIVVVGLWLRSCFNRPAKLNEQQIQKAQQAIAKRDRAEMERILAESDTAEAEIDSNLKQIEIDREAARRNYNGWSNEELAAELERRK